MKQVKLIPKVVASGKKGIVPLHIYDNLVHGVLGGYFVVAVKNGRLIPLGEVLRDYMFPINEREVSIAAFCRGYDNNLGMEFYDPKNEKENIQIVKG
jgi:hypothetical protein